MLLFVDFAPTIYLPGTEYKYVYLLTAAQFYEANTKVSVAVGIVRSRTKATEFSLV